MPEKKLIKINMKHFFAGNRNLICVLSLCLFFSKAGYSYDKKPSQEFYQITVYHFKAGGQEKELDDYLQHALLPALHKLNQGKIGVFKPIANDTATDKLIYVFIPLKS